MSLIIKSDKALSSLKRIDEMLPIRPVLQLDFRDAYYAVNDNKVEEAQMLTVSQPQETGVVDVMGNYRIVPPNKAQISNIPYSFKKGLKVERRNYVYFKDPLKPKSQRVVVNALRTHTVLIEVAGSGKAVVSTAEFGSMGEATEGRPLSFPQKSSTTKYTIDITIVGHLDFAQVYLSELPIDNTTRHDKQLQASTEVKINKSALDSVLPDFSGCIVTKVHVSPVKHGGMSGYGDEFGYDATFAYLAMHEAVGDRGLYVGYRTDKFGHYFRLQTLTDGTGERMRANLIKPRPQTNIVAVNFSKTKVEMYLNGKKVNEVDHSSDPIPYSDIFLLGSPKKWGVIDTNGMSHMEQCLVYDRHLTADEMRLVTSL